MSAKKRSSTRVSKKSATAARKPSAVKQQAAQKPKAQATKAKAQVVKPKVQTTKPKAQVTKAKAKIAKPNAPLEAVKQSAKPSKAKTAKAKHTQAAQQAVPARKNSPKPAPVAGLGKRTAKLSKVASPPDVAAKPKSAAPPKPKRASASVAGAAQGAVSPRPAMPVASAPAQLSLAGLPGAVPTATVDVGDWLPEFLLVDQSGARIGSDSLLGAPFVLYFYPKDDTPGCTAEACGFRDEMEAFSACAVRVIGVSPDKPAAHGRFAQKYELNFTLLADVDRVLCLAFGVWKLKKNYGHEYFGVERSTFLIGKGGKILRAWRGVRVAGHVSEVLEAAKKISGNPRAAAESK